jgi:hypothetical protein
MTAPNRELRGIRLTGAVSTTEVRLGTLLGVEHVIAPIVMLLGDSVIFPINAEHPEFVPAETLQIAPAGWNGRVLMAGDHPAEDGAMVSANIPSVLERQGFGQIFGARFEDNRLKGEVWIDPRRASVVADGAEILRRLRDGEPVEISVGCFVVAERTNGTAPNGQEYGSIWREIIPDHVALLREGLIGACSVEMGCGTPRAAVRHYNIEPTGMRMLTDGETAELRAQVGELAALRAAAATEAEAAAAEETVVTGEQKLASYLGAVGIENLAQLQTLAGMSDSELRDVLCEALRRVEPNFVAVTSVVPDDKTFVYLIDPDPGGPTPLKPYQRTYTLSADGKATLSEERAPVRQRTEWVPVTAAAADHSAARRDACSCGGHRTNRAEGAEGATMPTKAERVTALISNPRSPFEEGDRAYLDTLSEDRLTACETHAVAQTTEPTAEERAEADRVAAAAAAAAAGTVQVPAEELATLRSMAAQHTAQRNAKKNVLVNQLKGAQTQYSEARLKTMELEQLQDIAGLLQLTAQDANVDYVALDRAATTETTQVTEPPRPWSLAAAKRNGAQA